MKEKAIAQIYKVKQAKTLSRTQTAYLLEDGTVEISIGLAYPNLKEAQKEWKFEEVKEEF